MRFPFMIFLRLLKDESGSDGEARRAAPLKPVQARMFPLP